MSYDAWKLAYPPHWDDEDPDPDTEDDYRYHQDKDDRLTEE